MVLPLVHFRSRVEVVTSKGLSMKAQVGTPFVMVALVGCGIRAQSTERTLERDPNTFRFTSFSDWFAQFRYRAANLLAESLNDTERQELLKSIQVTPKTSATTENEEGKLSTSTSHSIAEAAAEAQAEEINKFFKDRWEREKKKLIQDAENAARERIESDLLLQKRRIAFNQWKIDLEKVKTKEDKEAKAISGEIVANKVPSNDAQRASELNGFDHLAPNYEPLAHPILGPCFLDVGYKRYHVVRAQALAAIPVWEKQRIYRHDRAKSMAVDKLKTMHLGIPGVIGLYEHSDGMLSILDGQHRVGMFQILESIKKDSKSSFLEQIVVEVYSSDGHDENHAKDIFLEINKAEPVKLVDMIAKGSDRKILNEAVDQLRDEYYYMFSSSTRCRPPHVNVDNVRDAIFAANVIGKHKMKSSTQLLDWLIQQNLLLENKYSSTKPGDKADFNGISAKALEKAIKNKFYLGLESSWYYN
jgi:hypothetical protein